MTTPLAGEDPRQLGVIAVESRIGEGGSAVVYLGQHPEHGQVAVKVIHRHLAGSESVRTLMKREAAALERVEGTRIARVLDIEVDAERPYLVVEYAPGKSLAETIQAGPLTGALLGTVLSGVAEALKEVHAAGIVHRDLKPSNIIFGPDGVKVVDFGISVLEDAASTTRTGAFMGTPSWLAPEQAIGRPVGPASDVFNFGMLIVFASTGRNPFGEGRPDAMLYRVVNEEPDLTGVPDDLRALAEECLAKDAAVRPSLAQIQDRLAGLGGSSGAVGVAADSTVLASRTVLGRAAHEETRATSRLAQPTSPKLKRRLLVGASAVLGVLALVLGMVIADNIAPFGGRILVNYGGNLTSNEFTEAPVLTVEVDDSVSGRTELNDSGLEEYHIASWRPTSTITVTYEPKFEGDETFERSWSAAELGLNYFAVGQPLWIDISAAESEMRLELRGGTPWEAESGANVQKLAREDEGKYRQAYRSCVNTANSALESRFASLLDMPTTYQSTLSEHRFSSGENADLSVWGDRAKGVSDDLFSAWTSALSAYSGTTFAQAVANAADSTSTSLGDLIDAWDTYSSALSNSGYRPQGLLRDHFPRENALIDLTAESLTSSVRELRSAIHGEAVADCQGKYPYA